MKVLWLCNNAPGVVRSALSGKQESQVNWLDHVLQDLLDQGITLRILYRGGGAPGQINAFCSYSPVPETPAHIYQPQLEERFRRELRDFQPDVIHSWGVEYHHALALVNAAEKEGMLPHMAASIQGLCCRIAPHYTDGLPASALRSRTFRDIVRHEGILVQQEQYTQRGELEIQALGKLGHVIGRTEWDRKNALEINPNVHYHHCDETLRDVFYTDQWAYSRCRKHRIFASSCSYPVKGFHILLEALSIVRGQYPDAGITVTGRPFTASDFKSHMRRNGYEKYLSSLVKRNHLDSAVHFLGHLSAQDMKQAYLDANVFVLPSTMENSPNALGEAMLLGTPCVAADVGGVSTMLRHPSEGLLYPSSDPEMLAYNICRVFELEDRAEAMGAAASRHAAQTHNPAKNLADLMTIYRFLSGEEG